MTGPMVWHGYMAAPPLCPGRHVSPYWCVAFSPQIQVRVGAVLTDGECVGQRLEMWQLAAGQNMREECHILNKSSLRRPIVPPYEFSFGLDGADIDTE